MRHDSQDADELVVTLQSIWRKETAKILLGVAVATCFAIGIVSGVIYVTRAHMYRTVIEIVELEREVLRNRAQIHDLKVAVSRKTTR